MKRVIIIGLDGLEPTIVESMLASGELPNLAKLRERGGLTRVATTTPAQTPVAWSTFATGTNPGGHGIFDFIRRDPATYLPDIALNRYEQKNAFVPPKAVNLRRGTAVWERLSAAGVGSTVVRCPCTYPPEPIRGRILSGMGVPDLRGGLGTSTFYSTADGLAPGESEQVIRLKPNPDGSFTTHLIGPRHPRDRSEVKAEITLLVDRAAKKIVVKSTGSPAELEVVEGQWSGWLSVKFKLGMLQTVRGQVRFHLVGVGPELELYASPLNFDPEDPPFPISSPPTFAKELAGRLGPFYTTGMVEDHGGLSNGRLDPNTFLDQCNEVWDEREAMMLHELDRFDQGLFFCLFDTPDRVQHMFWRHREPDHPGNRLDPADPALARVIEDHYRRGDAAVGSALDYVNDETLLIVMSDHGFGSFRRGVHLNTWLHEHGFLALKNGVRPGEEAGDLFAQVDWTKTRAYALGLGGIYLNLKGREAQGMVTPEDAGSVGNEIRQGLQSLRDPLAAEDVRPVRSVVTRDEVYSGPYAHESPDLMANFGRGYRVSWGSAMGAVQEGHFEDNTRAWGGDHIIDPALVPGILLMNRPFRGTGARLVDLAPTILSTLGVGAGTEMEGSPLL